MQKQKGPQSKPYFLLVYGLVINCIDCHPIAKSCLVRKLVEENTAAHHLKDRYALFRALGQLSLMLYYNSTSCMSEPAVMWVQ